MPGSGRSRVSALEVLLLDGGFLFLFGFGLGELLELNVDSLDGLRFNDLGLDGLVERDGPLTGAGVEDGALVLLVDSRRDVRFILDRGGLRLEHKLRLRSSSSAAAALVVKEPEGEAGDTDDGGEDEQHASQPSLPARVSPRSLPGFVEKQKR